MKLKYWAIILLATAAICLSAIYYVKQPASYTGPIVVVHHVIKSDEATTSPSSSASSTEEGTSGWKTYTNIQYGFSFEYPANYTTTEKNDSQAGSYIEITTPQIGGEDGDAITIVPSSTEPGYFSGGILPNPIEFTEAYFKSKNVSDYSNEYLGQLTIDGRTAFQLRHSEESAEKYTILQNKDGSFFTIQQSFTAPANESTNQMEPYDTLVSTFKFTN